MKITVHRKAMKIEVAVPKKAALDSWVEVASLVAITLAA